MIPGELQTVGGLLNHLRHGRRFVLQDGEAFQLPVLPVGELGGEMPKGGLARREERERPERSPAGCRENK